MVGVDIVFGDCIIKVGMWLMLVYFILFSLLGFVKVLVYFFIMVGLLVMGDELKVVGELLVKG